MSWLKNFQISQNEAWLFLGDFNYYRSTANRNKPGADMNDILIFNDIINTISLL